MHYRHEIKHLINMSDYMMIMSKLRYVATRDPYAGEAGQYHIRSLYFDNYRDKALGEKILGSSKRAKYRIRYYNDNTNFIKLEKKHKIDGLCAKESAVITKEACQKILKGDIAFLRISENPLYNDLYQSMIGDVLRPRTIVDYTREAYIYKVGNVRITFDKEIRTGISAINFLDKDVPTISVLDKMMVLEVKYDAFLPEIISQCIQVQRKPVSVSKYAICRRFG